MLGYRTFFSVDATADEVLEHSLQQFRRWLSTKSRRAYDGDSVEVGRPARLAPNASALVLKEEQPDGSRAMRATLTEHKDSSRWTTTLTVAATPDRLPWLWIDVDGPAERADGSGRRQWTATPNLAKALLSEFRALDGSAELGVRPQRAFVDDVDDIIDLACDPERRGLLFLAGSDPDVPLEPWIDKVANVLAETAGLASAYVLDAEATEALRSALGDQHAVLAGTLRTYRPGADPASALDARRHRILGRDRLDSDEDHFLRKLLGWRAREAAAEQPLPRSAVRLDARLEALTNGFLLNRLSVQSSDLTEAVEAPTGGVAATAGDSGAPDLESLGADLAAPADGASAVLREAEILTRLAALLQQATGSAVDSGSAADVLAQMAAASAAVDGLVDAQTDLRGRLEGLTERLTDTELELDGLRARLEGEQLEHAQTAQDLTVAVSERDQLRVELTTLGHGEQAWAVRGEAAVAEQPDSFSALLSRIPELERIRFTGSSEVTRSLETYDALGTWAAKTWGALRALNDYAAARDAGEFAGGVDIYLQETPPGRCGFSRQRHARDESESVKSNDKFRNARIFPVPKSVDSSGQLFMPAHLKIAQAGMISPRLHYAVGPDGCMYVGYIGPHLPTKATN